MQVDQDQLSEVLPVPVSTTTTTIFTLEGKKKIEIISNLLYFFLFLLLFVLFSFKNNQRIAAAAWPTSFRLSTLQIVLYTTHTSHS